MSPSSTQKSLTRSSLIIPVHTSMPLSPCWCLIHAWDRPSGPSRIPLISSVNKTFGKSIFRYFLAQSGQFSLCVLFSDGPVSAFFTLAMSLRSGHLVLLGTPGRLQLWNMAELEDNGFLVASRLILLTPLAVNSCLFHQPLISEGICLFLNIYSRFEVTSLEFVSPESK